MMENTNSVRIDKLELAAQMLFDLCSYLSGQDRQLENQVIPFLYSIGYTPEHFELLNICSSEEAKEYIAEHEEYKEDFEEEEDE